MSNTPETPLEILLFVVGIYFVILAVLSVLGGWFSLSRMYSFRDRIPENRKRFQSLNMGYISIFPVGYGNIVNVSVDFEALYLSVFLIFRPFHPPLKIPFSQLSGRERRLFFWRYVEMTTEASNWQKIWISKKLAEWIEFRSGGSWEFSRM